MISSLLNSKQNINFGLGLFNKKNIDDNPRESAILQNTIETRARAKFDRYTSAFTEYTRKGFMGDVNSDFYEFLSMGIVPYVIGSGTFMALFNLLGKELTPKAAMKGKKMALGVLMYGIFKSLSPDLVTRPVAYTTGVDIELPYRNVYYPLPKEAGENANIYPLRQQRKVYDSIEFFRKDLIQNQEGYGKAYYDNIAKKIGLGDNLNDSVTETTPIIQSIVSMTKTAKTLSSYMWAGVGVALAMQDSWNDFFTAFSNRRRYLSKPNESFINKLTEKTKNIGLNTADLTISFFKSFVKSFNHLWEGPQGASGFMKHAGKSFLLLTALLTIGTTANVIYKAKQMGKLENSDIIDKNKESTVI